MQTMSISAAKAKLNELVDDAVRTHEHVTITKNGAPAVMVAQEEWESLQETLFWQSQPGITEDLAAAQGEYEAGQSLSGEEIRRRYGLGQ